MNRLGSLSQIQLAGVWLPEDPKHVTSQWNTLPQATTLHELKRQLEKLTEKLPGVLKPNQQPSAQRDSDSHRNTNRDSTSQKHHFLFASFFFPLVFTSAPPLWIPPSQPSLHLRLAEFTEKKSMDKAGHRQVSVSRAAIPLFLHLPKSCPTPQAHVSIHCFTTRNWHMCLVSFPPKNKKPQVMETRVCFTVLFLKTYSIIMFFISVMMALDPEAS